MNKYNLNKEDEEIYKNKIQQKYDNIINKNEINIINFNYNNSSINNIFNFLHTNTLIFNKLNTVCIIFKIIRNFNIINYTYLYCDIIENNQLKYTYITLSPSLISKYGEFRRRLIPIQKLELLNNYEELISYFEKIIHNKINNKKFKLSWEYFSPIDININKYISNKMAEKYYIILYIIELYQIYNKEQELHINKSFNDTMFDNKDLKEFIKFLSLDKNNITIISNFVIEFSTTYNNFEYSQKIVPFSYLELNSVGNIIHPQWKEMYINTQISHLLYNFVTVGFPLYIDWFLINNSNKNVYDNECIFNKLLYNEQLHNLLNKSNSSNKTKYNKLIIENFNELKKRRDVLLQDNISNILYTNYSICYIYEYVGDTFYNNIKKQNILQDYNLFSKYLFEIIYNLYCLNLKGIIHKDLHLNNITIHKKFINNTELSNSFNLYNLNSNINNNVDKFMNNIEIDDDNLLDNKNNIYKFENNELYINIIDFNQSIIFYDLAIYKKLIFKDDKQYSERFIYKEQLYMLSILELLFPEYVKKNKNNLLEQLQNKDTFYQIFVKLTAYDTYKLTNYLLILFKNKKVDPKIISLITNMEQYLYQTLQDIINNKLIINKTDKLIFPNYKLLTTYFNDFNLTNTKINKNDIITNIFNINNIKSTNENDPENQYDFYTFVPDSININSKLIEINSQIIENRNVKINNIKQLANISAKNYNNIQTKINNLKKIIESDNNIISEDYIISNF